VSIAANVPVSIAANMPVSIAANVLVSIAANGLPINQTDAQITTISEKKC